MPESESEFDLEDPKRSAAKFTAREPDKPLPRLWKTEPDPSEDEDLAGPGRIRQEIIQSH